MRIRGESAQTFLVFSLKEAVLAFAFAESNKTSSQMAREVPINISKFNAWFAQSSPPMSGGDGFQLGSRAWKRGRHKCMLGFPELLRGEGRGPENGQHFKC